MYKISHRKQVYLTLIISIGISCISYLNVLIANSEGSFFESTILTSPYNLSIRGLYTLIIFPLLSSFCLSDIFLEDEQSNLKYILYKNYGVLRYHLKNVTCIFGVVFFITLGSLGFNLLLSYISFGNIDVSYTNIFTDTDLETYRSQAVNFDVFLKSPLAFLIIISIYISIFAGLFAQFSYLISSIIKNKYIIILIPTIIYNLITLVLSAIDLPGKALYFLFNANFSVVIPKPELIYVYLGSLIFINLVLFIFMFNKENDYVY